MNNKQFLQVIRQSFKTYLEVGTSRSTAKLKSLHGSIARDIQSRLGRDYSVISQGFMSDKEDAIFGRYYPKNVDITVERNFKPVAGYAVKFIMRNYSQNSNNYFENMLGETANIRSNAIPYFQILIVFSKVPYYRKGGTFVKYDVITKHNLEKYQKLSFDNPSIYYHTPNKTLIVIVKLKEKSVDYHFSDDSEYAQYYRSVINDPNLMFYDQSLNDTFGNNTFLNDYDNFITRTCYLIRSNTK